MKRSLLALAALTAFAGVASAQSSVTLFGVADVNMRNVKNGSVSVKSLSTDGIGSSRLGFRGVEDLGRGLRAAFWIEGGLSLDTGGGPTSALGSAANPQTWQRRSTVSLLGSFGEVRLGRDYTPDFWNHTLFDPFGTNGVGSSINVFASLNGATTTVRSNNSIGYFLPGGLGGIYGQAMISAGEGTDVNKHQAFRVGYAAGPLNVAFAYGKTNIDSANADWKRTTIGGSYKIGVATLMAQYNIGKAGGGADNGREYKHWLLGGALPMGAGTIKASYVQTDGSGPGWGARDATQIALGYQYDLSKRTALYTNFSRISNDGAANFQVGPANTVLPLGRDSTGYEFGVRHSF